MAVTEDDDAPPMWNGRLKPDSVDGERSSVSWVGSTTRLDTPRRSKSGTAAGPTVGSSGHVLASDGTEQSREERLLTVDQRRLDVAECSARGPRLEVQLGPGNADDRCLAEVALEPLDQLSVAGLAALGERDERLRVNLRREPEAVGVLECLDRRSQRVAEAFRDRRFARGIEPGSCWWCIISASRNGLGRGVVGRRSSDRVTWASSSRAALWTVTTTG